MTVENIVTIITSSLSALGAFFATLIAISKSRLAKNDREVLKSDRLLLNDYAKQLEKARAYTICPECLHKTYLKDEEVLYDPPTEFEKTLSLLGGTENEKKN